MAGRDSSEKKDVLVEGTKNMHIASAQSEDTKALFENKELIHEVEVDEVTSCTHDVRQIRFRLPHSDMISGILPGKHVKVSEQLGDKLLSRFYSPVSDPNMQGFFEIVFKVYPVSESDPLLGTFSRYMGSRKKGDRVKIAGPFGALAYKGHGRFENLKGEVKSYTKIGMIAGGTGITPMVQLIRSIAKDGDKTEVRLLNTNKTEDDIIFRDELENYKKQCGGRFDVQFTLTRVDKLAVQNWPYAFGRITLDMAKAILPPPGDDVLILICGRPDMGKTAKAFCQEIGYSNVHAY